jgi:phage/plasmid-associated DNA primase
VANATAEYRETENRIGQFVEERCFRDPGEEVGASAIFRAYCEWSEERRERPMNQTRFGAGLSGMGFGRRKSHGKKFVTGLRLASSL